MTFNSIDGYYIYECVYIINNGMYTEIDTCISIFTELGIERAEY